jgi:hypothetical protein
MLTPDTRDLIRQKLPELNRNVCLTLAALADFMKLCRDDAVVLPLMKPSFRLLQEWRKWVQYVEAELEADPALPRAHLTLVQ